MLMCMPTLAFSMKHHCTYSLTASLKGSHDSFMLISPLLASV